MLQIGPPPSTHDKPKEHHYSIDSNEWECGSDKSSSDYELEETFKEPGEPTD